MKTALDDAAGWRLEKIECDTERDRLNLVLCEKFLIEGRLKHTTESRRALVGFSGVVAYLMADETNLPFEAYDERDEGYLHNYSKSRFLDFINRTSGDALFDSIPTPSKHYGLTTSDHIVFVLATKEPQLEIVR